MKSIDKSAVHHRIAQDVKEVIIYYIQEKNVRLENLKITVDRNLHVELLENKVEFLHYMRFEDVYGVVSRVKDEDDVVAPRNSFKIESPYNKSKENLLVSGYNQGGE